jgi:endonuclease YncB( thermonuclease family)
MTPPWQAPAPSPHRLPAPPAGWPVLLCRVVSDGDTIDVLDNAKTTRRIRLAGIDAPERAQPFSRRARRHLSEGCFGEDVTVRVLGKDKHGRIIGHVSVNGDDACLSLLQTGLAWHYLIDDQSPEYAASEAAA